jgi:hypothetical protein
MPHAPHNRGQLVNAPIVGRATAIRAARAVLDAARARRDALPVRAAAEAAAAGSLLSVDEIEARLLALRARAAEQPEEPADG